MASQEKPAGPHELRTGEDMDTIDHTSLVEEKAGIDDVDVHVNQNELYDDRFVPHADVEYVQDRIEGVTIEECREYTIDFLHYHEHDYNVSPMLRERFKQLLEGPSSAQTVEDWALQFKTEVALCKYYSPYPEVRAVAAPTDDESMSCETIRAVFLGYAWAVMGQFTNTLFMSRLPGISVSSSFIQIMLYPCGVGLSKILPDWGITIAGTRHSLNPGPWTYKEQMLSTIIFDVGLGSAYCVYNIQTQALYYKDAWLTPGYGVTLLLASQLLGLGYAGMLRRYVIYPIESIWPSLLPTIALNKALLLPEKRENINGWTISRYKFFWIAFGIYWCYFWLPDFLFPAISQFNWMCWIAPYNFNLNVITGSFLGMGVNPIPTFDWNIMSYYNNPLALPFFSFTTQYVGSLLGTLVILALYYTNNSWTAYLPINSSGIFDRFGQSYNVSRVVGQDGVLNEAEYKAYSPPFYSAGNLMLYGAFFAYYPLTMVFVILDSWRPLFRAYVSMSRAVVRTTKNFVKKSGHISGLVAKGQIREASSQFGSIMNDGTSIYDDFDNPFTRILRHYPEVPDWWFFGLLLISFALTIIVITNWPELGTPVWTVFFVLGINLVFLIPMTYLESISGVTAGLNVVTELIVGYALPGHPEALMLVKAFGYNINGQADNYISDQKMGYYAKVPPRAMYRGQVLCTIFTALVAYGAVEFVDTNIKGICTPTQRDHFTCAATSEIYYSASVIWVS